MGGEGEMADERPGDEGSDSRRDPLVGTLVNGKYRVESAIARGGMGRIYYATQVPIERPVALKVVQGDGEQEHESQFLKRFLQEASILAKLQHPNVVTLFDYGRIEGSHVEQYFIAMEFLAGETLTHRLKVRTRLTAGETLVLARQIVRGLREAHKRGVIHRDLKPSNIIIVPEGDGSEIVKLVDFGIGKVMERAEDAQDLTQDGVFVGTPRYMAPEQFEGCAYPASDLYALGTILFQALAGRLPFLGSTMAEFMVAKLARTVPTVRQVAPDTDVPENLETLIFHLLARRPEDRPSMEVLHQHLLGCEEELFGAHSLQHTGSGPHSVHNSAHNMAVTGSGPHSSTRQLGSGPHSTRQLGAAPLSRPIPLPAPPQSWSGSRDPTLHEADSYGMPLRVPPTIVGPLPLVPHLTPRPMASSARPPGPAPAARGLIVVVVTMLVTFILGGGIYWKVARPLPAPPTVGTSPATTPPEGTPAVAFTLTIESTPAGATVSEGDNVLGETPLRVTIDHASVLSATRTFVVKKDGFAPSQVVQGASNDSVRSVVSLARLAPEVSSAVKSRPPVAQKPVTQATTTTAAKPTVTASPANTGGGPPTDIRLKR